MDLLDCMNRALDYIENNLSGIIDYDVAAKLAYCSTYHFERMFPYITGVSLSEYIRRRRLTLAAFELQSENTKIIDTALKYGYESPEAFSRAFKKLHGVSPVVAKKSGVTLKAYPRLSFQINIKGDELMNYRIEEKGAFEMFGVVGDISANTQEEAFIEVPKFCRKCDEDGTVDRMNEFLGRAPSAMLHAALFDHSENGFKYMICCFAKDGIKVPPQYQKLNVKSATWAIFPAENCAEIPQIWRNIYTQWFPTSGYEQADGPTFEMYYGDAQNNPTGEVLIPVAKLK
jgi:AraC family transcriptional regulator